MTSINLDGNWKLFYLIHDKLKSLQPADLGLQDIVHIPAVVPGNVELDMEREGKLADPMFADNILNLRKMEQYEWWYEKEFTVSKTRDGQQILLAFQGVDCMATYWLNGEILGHSENMFIEHRFDVTGRVNFDGVNHLHVQITPPIQMAMERDYYPYMDALPTNWDQLWVRKAPHSYGWDIMPRALSAGIWRSVELIFNDDTELEEVYLYTMSVEKNSARMGLFFKLKTNIQDWSDMNIKVYGECEDSKFEYNKRIDFIAGSFNFEVDSPRLWWPKGYGDPCLYQVCIEICQGDRMLSCKSFSTGIRRAELIRTDVAEGGNNGEFLIKVNNVPILCKGSNWVPVDVFHSRDKQRYQRVLELVADLNCNIIRCWGGNVYEDHAFFDGCDEHGIMVWQDFAMACANYPQDEQFGKSIATEAKAVIKKLRNHASIILWCGDNECDYIYMNKGLDPNRNEITRKVLLHAVFKNDPFRPYLPSSPYFSPSVVAGKNDDKLLENHLWGVRDYYKSKYYVDSTAQFIGEIGYHGCPNVSSIKKFIDEQHLWPWQDNEQWILHSTALQGKDDMFAYRIPLMANQIREMFDDIPDNLEDFVIASQISQAEAKKFFIEMVRLKKWRRTGIIWWNAMDGWPQFSDAVVDYYFGKKLAYHYIKRVQQPFCIMIDEPENWSVSVVAGNDSNSYCEGKYEIWDADSGDILLNGRFESKANENILLGRIPVFRGQKRLFLIEWEINGVKFGNHYIHGYPSFDFELYRNKWLEKISSLNHCFNWKTVGL